LQQICKNSAKKWSRAYANDFHFHMCDVLCDVTFLKSLFSEAFVLLQRLTIHVAWRLKGLVILFYVISLYICGWLYNEAVENRNQSTCIARHIQTVVWVTVTQR